MLGTMVITGLLLGCSSGKDSGGKEAPFCREVSFVFDDGPTDQVSDCVDNLQGEIERVEPGADFSNISTGDSDFESITHATLSSLHGQLNGYVRSNLGATDNKEAYEVVCGEYISRMRNQPPPHGEEVGLVCDQAEAWATKKGLSAYFSCDSVYLSDAMTATLGALTAADETVAFWSRISSQNGTNPNLIWLPMYLAMYHGGSPAALVYEVPVPTTAGQTRGTLAIMELGMEVHGEAARVEAFWNFINDPFDPDTYDGNNATDWSDLQIVLPSRLTWRENSVVQTWVLGEAKPEPFDQDFSRAFGIIDPCISERKGSEGIEAGGTGGSCDNSIERMMAVTHELKSITSFDGSAQDSCDRTPYDFSME